MYYGIRTMPSAICIITALSVEGAVLLVNAAEACGYHCIGYC